MVRPRQRRRFMRILLLGCCGCRKKIILDDLEDTFERYTEGKIGSHQSRNNSLVDQVASEEKHHQFQEQSDKYDYTVKRGLDVIPNYILQAEHEQYGKDHQKILQRLDDLAQKLDEVVRTVKAFFTPSAENEYHTQLAGFRTTLRNISSFGSIPVENDDCTNPLIENEKGELGRMYGVLSSGSRVPEEHDETDESVAASGIQFGSRDSSFRIILMDQVTELKKYADSLPGSNNKNEVADIFTMMEKEIESLPRPPLNWDPRVLQSPSFSRAGYPSTPVWTRKQKRSQNRECIEMEEFSPRRSTNSDYVYFTSSAT